jgi:predicted Zn-dependent protease
MKHAPSAAALCAALAVAACATRPVTGQKDYSLMSEPLEVQMGQEMDPQVRTEMAGVLGHEIGHVTARHAARAGGLIPALDVAVLNGFAADTTPPAAQRIKIVIAGE